MAIFTRPPLPAAAAVSGGGLHQAVWGSALPLIAVLRREYQIAEKRLLVYAQQVRLVPLDVGTHEIPIGRDAYQIPERACIPAPGELELEKGAVVSLELGSHALLADMLGYGFA